MTNEKAIERIKSIQYQFQCSVDDAESEFAEEWQKESLQDNKECVEALDVAAKALRKDIDASNEREFIIEELENICSNAPEHVLELLAKLKTL